LAGNAETLEREMPPKSQNADQHVVVYDANCNICTRLAGFLGRWDRGHHLEVIPSDTLGLTERFPWIAPERYLASVQVICPDGRTFESAAAIEELLHVLPFGWLAWWVFWIPGVRPLAEKLYRWFARNRYHFGCGDACPIRRMQRAGQLAQDHAANDRRAA
jgi:predicted DCC family thiol-disulfide oxidoreductase YuxK